MNSKQLYTYHSPRKQENRFQYQTDKHEQFMNHFNSIKNSSATKHKTSSVTTAPDYSRILQQYSQKISPMDQIVSTFENPRIYDLLKQPLKFTSTNAHLTLPNKITTSLLEINKFFNRKQPLVQKVSDYSFLNIENLSQYIASSLMPSHQVQEIIIKNSPEHVKSQFISMPRQNVPEVSPIDTKIDLLLAQLQREKKRKNDDSYETAISIKLTELIDYLTKQDQSLLGLSLNQKAKEISHYINDYKNKTIDGYLLLPLIQLFFEYLNFLHLYQLERLKQIKKSKPRKQTCSQLQKKSIKSQKSQGGKFSEPRGGKKKDFKEQQWIGKLD